MILEDKMFEWSDGFRSLKYGDDFDDRYGFLPFELSNDDIQSLKDGKVLCSEGDEYAVLIRRTENREENRMSVSKWAYTPEKCDGDYCPGDCDNCSKANEDESEDNEE